MPFMLKRINIFWKLSTAFIIIIVLVLVGLDHVNGLVAERDAVSAAREIAHAYSETILGGVPGPMTAHDTGGFRERIRILVESNPESRDVRLVSHATGRVTGSDTDDDGTILSRDHPTCRRCHDLESPAERLAAGGYEEIRTLATGERIVSVTIPIFNEEGCRNAECHIHADAPPVLGLLESDFSLAVAEGIIPGRNLRSLLAVAIAVVMSLGATWIIVNHSIKRPVRKLVGGMNKLAEKEFEFRLEEDEKDEFGSLASSFNDMASMLSSSLTELKKNRDYLESILESSADIIITVNASGKIQTINTGTEKALGYQRLDLIGKPVETLFAAPYEREVAIEMLKYSDNVVNYETRFLTKSGEVRDVLFTLSQLRNITGEIIGTIGIGKDITEEKSLQNQLIQSQRFAAIGQVFTGIQHSMKNMLNACKGGAYMVKTGLAKDNRKMLEEGWEIVQEGITSLTNMSLDMLKYVKEWKPKYSRVDITQLLSKVYLLIKQSAKDRRVEIRLDVPPGLPAVRCDGRMIHSAVMDIVTNAVDACLWKDYRGGEVPRVVVSAYPVYDRQELAIEVRDNGCGMTEEVKMNIFTPFFTTKSKAGTGLGLSITSRMINAHGGKIDVESHPDRGTVFRIVLPMSEINDSKETHDGEKGSGGR